MPKTETKMDEERLRRLVRELTAEGARVGAVTNRRVDHVKGLAFVLRDPDQANLAQLLDRVDFTLPLSAEGLDTLEHLKRIVADNHRLKGLAVTDELTGLYNVRFFRDRLEVELERVKRTGKPCSLIMLDLDKFKAVNDSHGHQAGDEVLISVAEMIRISIRAMDIPVRYGGDEVAVILPDTGSIDAFHTADRIRARIEDDPRTGKYGVTASVGLATHHFFDQEAEARFLVDRADQALYQAKRDGGNRVWFHDAERLREIPTEVSVSERDSLFSGFGFDERQ